MSRGVRAALLAALVAACADPPGTTAPASGGSGGGDAGAGGGGGSGGTGGADGGAGGGLIDAPVFGDVVPGDRTEWGSCDPAALPVGYCTGDYAVRCEPVDGGGVLVHEGCGRHGLRDNCHEGYCRVLRSKCSTNCVDGETRCIDSERDRTQCVKQAQEGELCDVVVPAEPCTADEACFRGACRPVCERSGCDCRDDLAPVCTLDGSYPSECIRSCGASTLAGACGELTATRVWTSPPNLADVAEVPGAPGLLLYTSEWKRELCDALEGPARERCDRQELVPLTQVDVRSWSDVRERWSSPLGPSYVLWPVRAADGGTLVLGGGNTLGLSRLGPVAAGLDADGAGRATPPPVWDRSFSYGMTPVESSLVNLDGRDLFYFHPALYEVRDVPEGPLHLLHLEATHTEWTPVAPRSAFASGPEGIYLLESTGPETDTLWRLTLEPDRAVKDPVWRGFVIGSSHDIAHWPGRDGIRFVAGGGYIAANRGSLATLEELIVRGDCVERSWFLQEPGIGFASSSLAVGDLDGDGRPELVWGTDDEAYVFSRGPDDLPLYRGQLASTQGPMNVKLLDGNGDGRLEVWLIPISRDKVTEVYELTFP